MIKYDRLWRTMKEKGVSQYDLYTHFEISRSMLDRFLHNRNVETVTIDKLCGILHCNVEDIMEYVEENLNKISCLTHRIDVRQLFILRYLSSRQEGQKNPRTGEPRKGQ